VTPLLYCLSATIIISKKKL
jgi:hypothetical protein